MRSSFSSLCVAWAALVIALTVASDAAAARDGVEPVIPVGQEDLLAAMLGRGEVLPGDCRFAGGEVNAGTIRVTYTCASGPVTLKLVHVSRAPSAAAHTSQFALVPYGGTAPPELLAALVSRIGAREGVFEWKSLDPNEGLRRVVRLNVLAFVVSASIMIAVKLARVRRGTLRRARGDLIAAAALTAVAALLRCLVAANVSEPGGVGYSRMLVGNPGHLGTAELYGLVYAWTGRGLEHAILLNRIASTVTVPLVYALCRRLVPAMRSVAVIAATLVAVHPLHLLFSATDALPISTSFLAAASYLLLTAALVDGDATWLRALAAFGALTGLTLLSQIRFENAVLLLPPLVYAFVRRRTASLIAIVPGAVIAGALLAYYGFEAHGSSIHTGVPLLENLRAAAHEVIGNPMFAIAPVFIGSAAAALDGRSRIRWLAPLPVVALVPIVALAIRYGSHDYASGTDLVALGRVYINQVVPLSIVTGYGLALMSTSARRSVRLLAFASVLWAIALPGFFWSNLRERHVEIAEHDFFVQALATLPSDAARVVVPDDELLNRTAHSTSELLAKYELINESAIRPVSLIGMTRFLEHADDVDCGHGACFFFHGVPCADARLYGFAQAQCAELMARTSGPPVVETDVAANSFRECGTQYGAARRRRCGPGPRQRLGLYRLAN